MQMSGRQGKPLLHHLDSDALRLSPLLTGFRGADKQAIAAMPTKRNAELNTLGCSHAVSGHARSRADFDSNGTTTFGWVMRMVGGFM